MMIARKVAARLGRLAQADVEKLLPQPTDERGGHLGPLFRDKNMDENRTVYVARFVAHNAHMKATLQGTLKLRIGLVRSLGFEPLLHGNDEVSLTEPGPKEILASLAAFRERTSATDHLRLLEAASFATPESCAYSSSLNRKDAASTFSSRWGIEEVPGIGSMTGDRFNNQASATCLGVLL